MRFFIIWRILFTQAVINDTSHGEFVLLLFLLYNSFTLPDKNCKNNWAKLRVNTQNIEVTYLENKALNTEQHIFPLKAAKNNPHHFYEWIQNPGEALDIFGNFGKPEVQHRGDEHTDRRCCRADTRVWDTSWEEVVGNHHDKTPRASVSIFSSSFNPSRPPWTFSGLSRTSTLLVYGSNLTEKGRLMPATYVLWQRHKEVRRPRWDSFLNSSWMHIFQKPCLWILNPNISLGWRKTSLLLTRRRSPPVVSAQIHYKDWNNPAFISGVIKTSRIYSISYFTMLWQTLPCCYFLIQCGRVLHSARDQTLSKHSVKLLVLQGNIWCVCQIKLQRFALVWKNTLVTAVFWLLWLTYKSLWPQGLAACSLTLSSHNPSLPICFFFSSSVFLCSGRVCTHGSGTWTSPWHLKNSQKWSRRAGTSGPGRAAPPRPPDRTLSSLARRTASAEFKFKKKKEEEAGEFSWQLSLAVNVAFF